MEAGKLPPTSTEEERIFCKTVTRLVLGREFALTFDEFPRSVGVKGDERIHGETVCIVGAVNRPAEFLADNEETLELLSSFICEKVFAVSRVLFDFTSPE